MAPRKSKAADRSVPATAWPKSWGSAPQLHDVLTQIARFFDELGYGDARSAIAREAEANGIEVPVIEKGTAAPKHALMQLWRNKSEDSNEGDASQESSDDMESGALVDDEAEETSSDGSNGSSGSEGSAKAGRKRKRVLTPPSSEDDDSLSDSDASGSSSSDDSGSSSNSSSDSSDDSRPARKRAKRSKSSSSSNSSSSNNSSSDSSSDSDSSSTSSNSTSSKSSSSSSSSSSDSSSSGSPSSSSSSDSASDSEKSTKAKKSKKVKHRKDKKLPKKKKLKLEATSGSENANPGSTTSSSVTLGAESAPENKPTEKLVIPASETNDNTVKQLPATKENIKQLKKQQVPFSRIPADQKVDPRFASNEYISYDYADRAYQDLVVTKGKGFTKEKNKKKRGAYRGGAIDLTPKGIKFED